MTINEGLFSSKNSEWETPQWLFDQLDAEFSFTFDLCATEKNTKCDYFSSEFFDIEPVEFQRYFMNPPYIRGKLKDFIQRAWRFSKTATVVCLIPARTDTKWWGIFWDHENHRPRPGCEVRFIKGRLKFGGSGIKNTAPFPSAIIVMKRWAIESNATD